MYPCRIGAIHMKTYMIYLKTFIQNLKALSIDMPPLKKLSPKEIKIKNKPWLNVEILKMIKIRNKVFHRKKRQPNNEHCKQTLI